MVTWNTFDKQYKLFPLSASITECLNILLFLTGFRRFVDESISAGGKFSVNETMDERD